METTSVQGFRLSPLQQRLWALGQVASPGAFRSRGVALVEGEVDRQLLHRALSRAVARHEILRTTFELLPGMAVPLQVIHDELRLRFAEHDLSGLAASAQEAEVRRLLAEDLPELAWITLASDRHLLRLSLFALQADAAGLENLLRDLSRCWTAAGEVELPPEPMQYADIAEWLNEAGEGAAETDRARWQELLGAAAADLPGESRSLQSGTRFAPHLLARRLAPDLSADLENLARRQESRLADLLLAVWGLLLARWTGRSEVVVAAALEGRRYEELRETIGPLARYLPVHWECAGEVPFVELLRKVTAGLEEVSGWQEIFTLGESAFFPFCFDFHSAGERFSAGTVQFRLLERDACLDRFKVRLSCAPREGSIAAVFHYDSTLLSVTVVGCLAAQFEELLRNVAMRPESVTAELSAMTAEERHRLVAAFNQTAADSPREQTFHRLFEERARMAPHALALCHQEERLTYRELDLWADRIAARLRRIGLRPEDRVGILLERSPETLACVIGTLKAGGAYLPLDLAHPPERLAFLLRDSAAAVLLTRGPWRDRLSELPVRVVLLDDEPADSDGEPESLPDVAAESLAYVLYTSGSTGQPKGVMVPHRGLVNYLTWAVEAYAVAAGRGALVDTPLGFDLTITTLLSPLIAGQAVVLLPESGGVDSLAAELRAGSDFTLAKITPAHLDLWRHLETAGPMAGCVRTLVIGGEALHAEQLSWWHRHSPSTRLINEYGPTETVVGCCVYEIPATPEARGSISIGRPIANSRIYVVDGLMNPVPVGVAGEILIGGDGVARGYFRRPDLTAERFLPDPFADEPGQRLYRTGDLARHLPEDGLEFLGRIDHQVKLRGFRIELGEIEATLARWPGIRAAAVVLHQDAAGGRQLVAYFASEPERVPSTAELRAFLASQLPAYMVPSAFVRLPALPLTANGKVDRRALPAPDLTRPEPGAAFAAPRPGTEELLAEVWKEVLGVERVGIDDRFFDLGGDSIRNIQVMARARARGLAVSLQQLLDFPTIRELAREVALAEAVPASPPQTRPFSLISDEDRTRLPQDVEDAYPLATLQAGMLFHSEYRPGSGIYHDAMSYHLETPFDASRLRDALARLMARHPVLRTSFDLTHFSEPLQLVHTRVDVPLTIDDLSHRSKPEQDEILARWFEEEKGRDLAWTRPPLLRVHVHRRDESSVQLTLSFHHAILDGWSVASLLTELFQLYFSGEEAAPPPGSTYRDYVGLERAALESAAARDYWLRKLAEPPFLQLCRWPLADGPSGPRLCREPVTVSPASAAGLRGLAAAAGVPFKSVLLAAHLRVLSFLGGDDILTGVVSHGRPETDGTESVLGLFLNTLPFRLTLPAGNWIDLARATFAAEREMIPFQRYPLAEIQRLLGAGPLFEVLFNYVHFHVYDQVQAAGRVRVLGGFGHEETNYPLVVNFTGGAEAHELVLELSYDATVFGAAQIRLLAGYFAATVAAMASEPEAPLRAQALLSPEERHQLLHEWNGPAAGTDDFPAVHRLFEAQAARTPDALAVVAREVEWSYRVLSSKAGRLARTLRRQGVGPEVFVGIYMTRSAEMIAGLLAVLEAGGAYVPLDPQIPEARLELVLEEVRPRVILTQEPFGERLAKHGVPLVFADRMEEDGDLPDLNDPAAVLSGSNLTYLIYTSGSTGRPKGVLVQHRSLAAYVADAAQRFSLSPGDRVLQFASISFDTSAEEIFPCLASGATLVLRDEEMLVSPEDFLARLETWGVTVVDLPTAYWHELTAGMVRQDLALPAAVRLVIIGGEQALSHRLADWRERVSPRVQLLNGYGPTEATIVATWRDLTGTAAADGREVPIGRPWMGARAYVLNPSLEPVPVGVRGELFIGGTGLARGYLRDPRLTAERFHPDPFSGTPGARLYRTGDLALFLPDGTIELSGRGDRQVKVRGFRIELGEVESALTRHSGLKEAVVEARSDGDGEKRLVAYLVPAGEQAPDLGGLRDFLSRSLPGHSVPSFFVVLPALPLTSSGKVDRRALPDPKPVRPDLVSGFQAPRTPAEELIAGIWRDVLGLERVGVYDDFFQLGGHSLLATRIVSRIRQTLGVDLPLRRLFETPTIAALADGLEGPRSGAGTPVPSLERAPRGGRLELSFAQQRLWFLDRLRPGSCAYNIPYALRLSGALKVAALARALGELQRRHEILRTVFREIEGEPAQVILPPRPAVLPQVDLGELAASEGERELQRLVQGELQRPFDLAQGPLLRTLLVRLRADEWALLASLHHIVSDGWSEGVLTSELTALYNAFAAGRPSPLPDLALQYVDFAHWQRRRLQGELLDGLLAYWRRQLAGAAPVELPADHPRGTETAARGGFQTRVFDPSILHRLRDLSQREGVTLFMTLLAAFSALLYRWTGQEDCTLGTPVANRNRVELEGLIGFFVNTLVLRTDLSGNPSFQALLARVREVTLGAYAHQDLPFERLVEALQPARALDQNPFFNILFVHQSFSPPSSKLDGLQTSRLGLRTTATRFDVQLTVIEEGEGLRVNLHYNALLYSDEMAEEFLMHYEVLAGEAGRDPSLRLLDLPLTTAGSEPEAVALRFANEDQFAFD